jgi:predicted nucleotidyltransferase
MNEASVRQLALAQQLAPYYHANPKVAAVLVEGSVARGYADRFSDIDLAVFWSEAPTEKERRDVIKRASGRHVQLSPPNRDKTCRSDTYEVNGGTINVRHVGVEATSRILADVVERYDPSLSKQQHIATLLSATPLPDSSSMLTHWQQQARVYPHELRVAMVRAYLIFDAGWEQEKLAERSDLLTLYASFCTVEKHMLLVLMGLNRIYYPGFQWLDRLMEQMPLAPVKFASRFKQVFGIVSIDPLAGVYQLHELIEETFRLVETHLSEFDTIQARARFQQRYRIGNLHHTDFCRRSEK